MRIEAKPVASRVVVRASAVYALSDVGARPALAINLGLLLGALGEDLAGQGGVEV